MDIKEVRLVLENSEEYVIESNYIVWMAAETIVEDIHISHGRKSVYRKCKDFRIEIAKEANQELFLNPEEDFFEKKKPFIRILEGKDVAQVHIKNSEEGTEWFFVDWQGQNDYENDAQKTEERSNGNLLITVKGEHL